MPLGWGRAVGSYVASHFGSLGRPPGTKKGILQLYNNETGLSSSTQLQNHATKDDRKSIHTSAENSAAYLESHDASKQPNDEDGRYQENSQTINLEDGLTETNYMRSLQIGALLALCYNLFSGHLRLRAIQAQKPILTGNTKKAQLMVANEKSNHSLSHLEQNGLVRWNEVSSIEAPRKIAFSNWYHSRPSLNTINSSFPPTSAINSFLLPRVFESLLPSNSILPFKKSINYKPISLNCTYKKDGPTTQHCKEACDIKSLELELKPILEEDSGVFERKSEIDELTDDQIQVTINSTYQHDINLKSPTSSPAINNVVTHQCSESDETDQLSLRQSEENTAIKAVEKPNSSLNSAEAEMLRMGEVIDLTINASEALKLLDMGYHEKGMEILKEVARCNHAESNFNLGVIFERGLYRNQISIRKAIKYYVKATKLNYPASFYNLGLVYEQSVDKTEQLQANTLFEKAAELGLFEAKKKLGLSLQPKKGDGYEIHGKCKMCQDIGWQESEDNNVTIPASRPETCFTLARAYHFGTSGMPQDKKICP